MENLYADAPCLYFAFTDSGLLTVVNTTLARYTGFGHNDLVGRKLDTILTLSTRLFCETHFFPLLKLHGHAAEIYMTLKTTSGHSLPVLLNANREITQEGYITVCAGIVVTERKKFEDELVAARKTAEAALNESTALIAAKQSLQKHAALLDMQMTTVKKQNEELWQYNHAVTHELQEPLRKLFVYTNMLLETESEGTNQKTVKKIRQVSQQMQATLQGLQQYAWLIESDMDYRSIVLEPFVAELAAGPSHKNEDVHITIAVDASLVFAGDKEQMTFLLQELLANAIRFRKPDQPLHIGIRATPLRLNKYKSLSDQYQYAEYLKLEISDNGTGFDSAYTDQAFQLFKRLHPVSGSGVGLSLCKKIVESHQGTIHLDTMPGEGTTVSVVVPVQQVLPAIENRLQKARGHDS